MGQDQGSSRWRNNPVVRFLVGLAKFIRGYFIFVGVMITALLIFAVYSVYKTQTRGVVGTEINQNEPYLMQMQLRGQILDEAPNFEDELYSQFFGKPAGIYLPDLQQDLRDVAKNPNLKGIFVKIDSLSASAADYDELRSMFAEFKTSGKDLQFWFATAGDASYYLASVGSKISMPAVSDLTLTGPTFTFTYFGEALRKIGVDINVIRAGKYKSFFESFVSNKPSDETLEAYNAIETSMRTSYAEKIAIGRGLKNNPVESVSAWFRQSLFSVAEAKQLGIIDVIEYENDALARMQTELKVKNTYKFSNDTVTIPQVVTTDSIALIEAVGEIHMNSESDQDVITPGKLQKQLEWAAKADDIKAVVLRISSPGGSAIASDLIWHEVKKLADKKPVVVSMGSVAASGGYYIAVAAHKILAQPNTITGSIGVISMLPNFAQFEEKYGISFATISNSDRKNILGYSAPPTDEDKRLLGEMTDNFYREFMNRVAEGRKMAVSDVDSVAQGRVWTGSQALAIKLVDELGGLDEAFIAAKKLAKLDPKEKYPVKRYVPKNANLFDCMKMSNDLSECMGASGARLKAIYVDETTPYESKQLLRVRRLIEMAQQEPTQMLWDGYFSTIEKR